MRTGSNFVLFASFFSLFSFLSCLNVNAHFCFGFCLLCVCGRYFVSFFLSLAFVRMDSGVSKLGTGLWAAAARNEKLR